MKLAAIFLCLPLLAQEAAKEPVPVASGSAPSRATLGTAQEPAKDPVPIPSPLPAENWLTGSFEAGYRWLPATNGSLPTYRSIVNLGEGLKLINADFTILPPSHRFFDRADVHASSWGGDPYNTLRVDVKKESVYRLNVDYRNIAYFNFLPSFATGWNSFDTRMRGLEVQLDLLPGRKIEPYLAYSRNAETGRGISVFVGDRNEYPIATFIGDRTNNIRAGVRIDLWRGHLTLEEGGTTFRDDQGAANAQSTPGDQLNLVSGQRLRLDSFTEGYGITGHSAYSKALLAVNPFSWMSVAGAFMFAQPSTGAAFNSLATGTLYSNALLQTIARQQDVLTAAARMPHSSGSLNVELRPFARLRIVNFWMTDRLHDASSALLNLTAPASDRTVVNYSQEEVNVFYDLTKRITLRGGYRYAWGDSQVRARLNPLPYESGSLRRQVGIGGVTYKVAKKIRVVADFEAAASDQAYFRTSLRNYQKARVRASFDVNPALRFSADFTLLNNNDPDPQIRYEFKTRNESVAAFWTPTGARHYNLLLDYSRSSVSSNITYLAPQDQSVLSSNYRENGHTGTALAGYRWLSLGGSFFKSSGSRPSQYYQPMARLAFPINKHVQWNAEWRWYGFSERYYGYENVSSHQLMMSIRFTR